MDPPPPPQAEPPYPDLIIRAITALKQRQGSTIREEIDTYIQSVYTGYLPPNHGALLTHHLQRMLNLSSRNCPGLSMVEHSSSYTVRFRGVRKNPEGGTFGARFYQGNSTWLGSFATPEEAARAYDVASIKKDGAKAKTNFPLYSYDKPDVDEQSDRLDTQSNDRTFINLESPEKITDRSVKDQFSRPKISTDAESNDRTFINLESPEKITDKSVKDQFSRPKISTDADFGLKDGNEAVFNVDDVAREATVSLQVKENVGSSSRDRTDFQTAGIDGSNKKVMLVESMSQNAEHLNNDVETAERMKSNGHKTDTINHAANIAENIPVDHTQNTVEIPQRSIRKRKQVLSSQSLAEERADNPKDDQSIVEALPQKGRKKVAKKPHNDRTNGVRPPKNRREKEFARRNSIAGAGSRWEEGGLRRSCRIRTKPLKHHSGERFIFGRIHESLPTVIGLKYDSPEQGADNCFKDKRNLKVKSFVPEEFEELVMRRSLY